MEHSILPTVQQMESTAQKQGKKARWAKWGAIVLIPLLCLLTGYASGVLTIKSGINVMSEDGCTYLGGEVIKLTPERFACAEPQ